MLRKKSVAIVGCGASAWKYIEKTMYEGGKWTDSVYTINRMGIVLQDVDITFRMDDMQGMIDDKVAEEYNNMEKYQQNILARGMVMTSISNTSAVEYPLTEVCKSLDVAVNSVIAPRILNNTYNYAVAYALSQKYTDLYLFGHDFYLPDGDLKEQKGPWWRRYLYDEGLRRASEPGAEGLAFLIGWAHAKKRGIHQHLGTAFMDGDRPAYYYGYWEQPDV